MALKVGLGTITLARDEIEKIEFSSNQEKDRLQQQWQQAEEQAAEIHEAQKKQAQAESVELPAPALSVPVKEAEPEQPIVKKPQQLQPKTVHYPLPNSYYLLSVPQNANKEEGSALIIALHGWPSNPESFMKAWEAEGNRTQSFIACPKSTNQGWKQNDVDNIFKMVKEIKSNYNINPKKVFLVGVSYGGHFALYLGLKYPKQFKAIVNVSGSIARARKYIGPLKISRSTRRVPVLILIGVKDERVRRDNAKQTKEELSKYGYRVTYKVIAGFGHGYLMEFSRDITKWLGL
ncbi:MAG: prolyl oligopeptidase family serine peptidase [Candidatus Omnitrophica bacterium]|nr:prolyl oligopeptidase family serine peptidase [Candidatus Omnitrophota bacterium]